MGRPIPTRRRWAWRAAGVAALGCAFVRAMPPVPPAPAPPPIAQCLLDLGLVNGVGLPARLQSDLRLDRTLPREVVAEIDRWTAAANRAVGPEWESIRQLAPGHSRLVPMGSGDGRRYYLRVLRDGGSNDAPSFTAQLVQFAVTYPERPVPESVKLEAEKSLTDHLAGKLAIPATATADAPHSVKLPSVGDYHHTLRYRPFLENTEPRLFQPTLVREFAGTITNALPKRPPTPFHVGEALREWEAAVRDGTLPLPQYPGRHVMRIGPKDQPMHLVLERSSASPPALTLRKVEAGATPPDLISDALPDRNGAVDGFVRIGALRFTQKDISGSTTGGKPLKSVAIDMRDKGFDPSEAIDVVRQANGNLVTLDHRRVVAALAAGLTYVPATVHDPSEPIDRGSAGGYKLLAPLVLTDRTYPRNAVPTTWGEAALFRAYNQRHRTDADAKFPLDGTTTVPSMTAAELEDLRTAFPDYGK